MKSSYSISIPKPCSEKWEGFQKTKDGAFCQSCQHEVIDFTEWSNEKIEYYFSKRTNAKTCGRFKPEQLKFIPAPQSRNTMAAPLAALIAATLTVGSNLSYGQVTETPKDSITAIYGLENKQRVEHKVNMRIITGRIYDGDTNEPLPGVNVLLKNTNNGAVTDSEGNFVIQVDSSSGHKLLFTFIGYETEEKTFDQVDNRKIFLSPDEIMLGEVAYTRYSPRNIWWKIKSIFTGRG